MNEHQDMQANEEQEGFIPPYYMLIVSALGLVIALFVALTQREFSVVGWGGLGIAVLGFIAWALMAPDQLRAALTGRTAQYGGTAVIVTIVFLVALIAIYAIVKQQGWRVALSNNQAFSLTEEARNVIEAMGQDPSTPQVKIILFYAAADAGLRDGDQVLLDEFVEASNGKISYEFIDPDRNPLIAQDYGVSRSRQVAVVALDENGEPNIEKAELLNLLNQEQLTNAVLRVAAQGDFRAYFAAFPNGLGLDDGTALGLSEVRDLLRDAWNWQVEEITLLDMMTGTVDLNDPAADGIVLVLPGGSSPLPDEQFAVLTEYLDKGGDIVIFAGLGDEQPEALATAPNFTNYLEENFGLRINNDLVIDPVQAFQSPTAPVATTFDQTHFVTSTLQATDALVFPLSHSIDIVDEPPANVTVTPLAFSSEEAYAKAYTLAVISGDTPLDKADDDPSGSFVLAAAAENTETGARVLVFGSQYFPANQYRDLAIAGIQNYALTLNGLAWTTNFDSFASQISQVQLGTRVEDTPIFATPSDLSTISFITVILLPFGTLLIGVWVWWRNRERVDIHQPSQQEG